ncbi:uncharacterized protein G6M90_00g027460 [Metarhizium brunneum]|uniref:Uncharacterized protein n=1 Tax=Metarhizium brunneum TaxID=500148 RepID=A0A7D5YTP7_9HYPO|nr:hypothetical protein G6M90_00g027460 [Metarhizium brunneum]
MAQHETTTALCLISYNPSSSPCFLSNDKGPSRLVEQQPSSQNSIPKEEDGMASLAATWPRRNVPSAEAPRSPTTLLPTRLKPYRTTVLA